MGSKAGKKPENVTFQVSTAFLIALQAVVPRLDTVRTSQGSIEYVLRLWPLKIIRRFAGACFQEWYLMLSIIINLKHFPMYHMSYEELPQKGRCHEFLYDPLGESESTHLAGLSHLAEPPLLQSSVFSNLHIAGGKHYYRNTRENRCFSYSHMQSLVRLRAPS